MALSIRLPTICMIRSPSQTAVTGRGGGAILNEMWALRSLERIGDHAANIAEHVVYLVRGLDVRHQSVDKMMDQVGEL